MIKDRQQQKDRIIKYLIHNENQPTNHYELKQIVFNITDNEYLMLLSDMFSKNVLTSVNNNYCLNKEFYEQIIREKEIEKNKIQQRLERQKILKEIFVEQYYNLDIAKELFFLHFPNCTEEEFAQDLSLLNYNINGNYIVLNYQSIKDFFEDLLKKEDVINLKEFKSKYEIDDFNIEYIINKLCKEYILIEFEKEEYINIKKLSEANIYISNLKEYCKQVYEITKDGKSFTIKTLRKNKYYFELDDLGFNDLFYESILKNNELFYSQKVNNLTIFSTVEKPIIKKVVEDIMETYRELSVEEFVEILKNEFGYGTNFINNGKLANASFFTDLGTNIYYNKELETIYYDKEDYYKEIEYDE